MNTQISLLAYFIYLPVALGLTITVAHQLFKNGKVFMLDIFHQQADIALATNSLFKIGFYLLNVGFALTIIRMSAIVNAESMIVKLSTKIGGFAIYLGIMLMLNLYLFMRGRKKARQHQRELNKLFGNSKGIEFE
ncbi:hypothetical protein [Edaphocola aurantiacus]|uniref:hypothetical protein n=1 Tax=Edaphocola aurantiacus TaxID=2601682 RepID=UPI001C944C3D|nr:hypothetical protein [Edaphocola aurantiacus]